MELSTSARTIRSLYAVDGATGTAKWAFHTDEAIQGSPSVAADGTVYFGSNDSKIYALHGATGDKLWEFKTGYWVKSGPAIGPDGTVFVLSCDGLLYALAGPSPLAQSPWPKFRANPANRASQELGSARPDIHVQSGSGLWVEGEPLRLSVAGRRSRATHLSVVFQRATAQRRDLGGVDSGRIDPAIPR